MELEAMSSASTLMLKKDRRKLNKLRKRVVRLQNEGEQSGLLSFSQYEDYQALLVNAQPSCDSNSDDANSSTTKIDPKGKTSSISTLDEHGRLHTYPLACPTINFRKKFLGIKKVEGVHHRDLLAWLLQQKTCDSSIPSSFSKKRHRDDIGGNIDTETIISIPHWASIHNPVTCEQVAVLEIHVPHDKIDSYSEFLDSYKVRSDTQKIESRNIYRHTQIGITTKWFQGYIPKSMSETLLYFSNIKKDQKKTKNSDQKSIILSKKDLIERLATMVLSLEEMTGQGYPTLLSSFQDETMEFIDSTVHHADFRKEKLESLDNISLEMAVKFTERFGIRLQNQLEEDTISYIGTPKSPSIVNHVDNADVDESPIRVLGIDCEMVRTTQGSELARVTLIQFNQYVGPKDSADTTVLLDCLVRPRNRIIDYLTMYSGITPDLLEPISTRIEQVQYALASYLTSRDILVGHSLENDLRALHYIHPRVVDTSMIFRPTDKNKRFKFSLRHLSGVLLKRKIQNGSHCSEEDAQAALDIAFLKAFVGDELRVPGCGDDNRQSLLQKKCMTKSTAVFIGPNPWLEAHITNNPNGAHALSYDSPNDCKKAMLSWITGRRKAQLIWSKIVLETNSKMTSSSNASLETFKSLVTDIVEKLPSKCVLMVAVQGELHKARDMFKQRRACLDPRSSIEWSSDREESWKKLLESTRAGHVHWFSAATNNNT